MTICDDCKKTIWFLPFERDVKVSHTDRGGNRIDTQYKLVVKCPKCHFKEKVVKALNDLAWGAVTTLGPRGLGVIAILSVLAASWFSHENKTAPSQTVAVTAFAPKATAPKPRLIPPEDSGAR
jgi:hypothetical protein